MRISTTEVYSKQAEAWVPGVVHGLRYGGAMYLVQYGRAQKTVALDEAGRWLRRVPSPGKPPSASSRTLSPELDPGPTDRAWTDRVLVSPALPRSAGTSPTLPRFPASPADAGRSILREALTPKAPPAPVDPGNRWTGGTLFTFLCGSGAIVKGS